MSLTLKHGPNLAGLSARDRDEVLAFFRPYPWVPRTTQERRSEIVAGVTSVVLLIALTAFNGLAELDGPMVTFFLGAIAAVVARVYFLVRFIRRTRRRRPRKHEGRRDIVASPPYR